MTIDTRDFRRALSQYPTGVCVITTLDASGNNMGVTVSSFNTVSLEPPLVLWCIDKGNYSVEAYRQAPHFIVNVLRSDQLEISNRFASRGEDKFSGARFTTGLGGSAILEDTAATLECSTWKVYEGGDHYIIVGKVEQYQYHENASALVFHKGRYAVSEAHPANATTGQIRKGFVGNYLLYLLRLAYSNYSRHFYPKIDSLGITTQEWRILSLLAEEQAMSLQALMPLSSQPMKDLRETAAWLVDKGYATLEKDILRLTSSGQEIATRLLHLAQEHEADVIRKMGLPDGAAAFKGLLQKLAGVFASAGNDKS